MLSAASISMAVEFFEISIKEEIVSQKGLRGHWSKWGGARMDVIQTEIDETWICQSCGDTQPRELSPFKYEYPSSEWIRVCAVCIANDCVRLKQRLGLF